MIININDTSYPIFEANQVLKYTDLNDLIDYLDEQNRFTRTHLIGMGIVCGLHPRFTDTDVEQPDGGKVKGIKISPGCGITSEGYLIQLTETSLSHYQELEVPKILFQETQSASSKAADKNNGGDNGNSDNGSDDKDLIEVFSESAEDRLSLTQNLDGSDRTDNATKAFLADKIVVVVYEKAEIRRDSCLTDCDDKGRDVRFNIRFFLIPRTQNQDSVEKNKLSADYLLKQGYSLGNLSIEDTFSTRYIFWADHNLQIKRFGHNEETIESSEEESSAIRLSNLKTFDAFTENYRQICADAIEQINAALQNLFKAFSPLFSSFYTDIPADFSSVLTPIENKTLLERHLDRIFSTGEDNDDSEVEAKSLYAIQYFYDYLSLIAAAYHELATVAFDLMDDCIPDSRRFPKFLMLGKITGVSQEEEPCSPLSPYRSHFTQPPVYNGNAQRLKQVKHLYDRLLHLCAEDAFVMLPFYKAPLAMTPSQSRSVPLSQQAIPYYLNYPKIHFYWNYDACRKGISNRHPAYFYPNPDSNTSLAEITINRQVRQQLTHRLDAYSFYRIEGHVGTDKNSAIEEIREYQQRYNLAFDVVALKLGAQVSVEDLEISGHFDDLEADFGRVKDTFLKRFEKNEDWQENALITTLKREFFAQSGLLDISQSQLFNPILALAQDAKNYKFEPQQEEIPGEDGQPAIPQPTGYYWLYIVNQQNNPIARFSPNIDSLDSADSLIDLSNLPADANLEQTQEGIRKTLAACFAVSKVTFGLVPESEDETEGDRDYRLTLTVPDQLTLIPGQTLSIHLISLESLTIGRVFPLGISLDTNTILNFDLLSRFFRNASLEYVIKGGNFKDFETIYRLLWDLPVGFANTLELPYQLDSQDAANCLNYFEMKGLIESYYQRLAKLRDLHLFHTFATHHPGMEHLGGVPVGGTFILVYVSENDTAETEDNLSTVTANTSPLSLRTPISEQLTGGRLASLSELLIQEAVSAQKSVIVADFCLPYRCCSHTSAVNYLLAKPRPVVLLERSVFCEDDDTRYEFILDPAGGILKGEGSFLGYLYQLKLVALEEDIGDRPDRQPDRPGASLGTIVVKKIDEAAYQIRIYDADGKLVFERTREDFGSNQDLIQALETALASSEISTSAERDLVQRIALELNYPLGPEQYLFQPSRIDQRPNVERAITFTYVVDGSYDTFTVLVFPRPEAVISVGDTSEFCNNEDPVNINLAPLNSGQTEPENDWLQRSDVVWEKTTIKGSNSDKTFETSTLIPGQFAENGEAETVTVTVFLSHRRLESCQSEISTTVTVYPRPNPEFTVVPQGFSPVSRLPEENFDSYCAGNGETDRILILQPSVSETSDRFEIKVNDQPFNNESETPNDRIDLNQFGQEGEDILEITHYTRTVGACPPEPSTQLLKVLPLPNATFTLSNAVCSDSEIPPKAAKTGGLFKAFIGDSAQEIAGAIREGENPTFIAGTVFEGNDLTRQIVRLRHIIESDRGCLNEFENSLTVLRTPPAGDFSSSELILSSETNEFEVQISNIQPSGDYSYDWNFLDAESRFESKSNTDSFTINFTYIEIDADGDGETQIDLTRPVSISLTVVNTDLDLDFSCSGPTIVREIQVPFEIVDWELAGFTGENTQPLIELTETIKQNNGRISTTQFFQLGGFEQNVINVRTRPERVGSVQVTYQSPDSNQEQNVENNLPYQSQIWQPVVGTHTFTFVAFAGADGSLRQRDPFVVSFEIFEPTDEGEDDNGSSVVDPGGSVGGGGVVARDLTVYSEPSAWKFPDGRRTW